MFSLFGCVYVDHQAREAIVRNMFDALSPRGGDSKNLTIDEHMMMGIRGMPHYVQRAVVTNPSQSITAVVEGEIYNHGDLRKLVEEDCPGLNAENVFESIPSLYKKFGKDFPKYLNGIFAIALWDAETQTLYLIRDHLGSRSLFYAQHQQKLLFASTIQALFSSKLLSRDLSLPAIHTYFSSTAISPPATMFQNLFCVRPGAMAIHHNGTFSEYTYWPIRDIQENYQRSEQSFAQEVRELILDATTIRAQNQEAYGSIVSGGVDTGIITAIIAKLPENERKTLPVFSIAFEEQFYSDAPLQQIMYDRYNLQPHSTNLKAQQFADILQKGAAHLDCPVNDNAYVGMYKVFELVKQAGCSAVFEGEAADELFYTGHAHAEREFQRYLQVPFWLRSLLFGKTITKIPVGDSMWKKGLRLLFRLGLPDEDRRLIGLPSFYKHPVNILLDKELQESHDPFSAERQYLQETSLQDPLNIYYYGLLKTFLPNDLLFKNERMASANGIINRTPFIDYRLVELSYKIPQHYKIRKPSTDDDGTKLIYKKAIQGLMPDEILFRKKQRGFSQPSTVWYRNELKDFVYATLFDSNALNRTYLNQTYMKSLYEAHISEQANFDYLLSSLLIFELWLQAFLKQ